MKVGILSGTFDPIHTGHLSFAWAGLQGADLDKVYFLPEPRPRRKQGVKAHDHRAAMVRLAIHGEPKLGSILIDQDRFTLEKTLPVLKRRFKNAELYLFIGDDMLKHLIDWPQIKSRSKGVKFLIGVRRRTPDDIKKTISTLHKVKGLDIDYKIIDVKKPHVSSAALKKHIRRGKSPDELHPEVKSYISEHGLYHPAN